MTGTSLEIDHDDALGLAPARGTARLAAGDIRGPCRDRLQLEHRAETQGQQARPPDAENVAPRHAKLRITQVLPCLSGDDDHRVAPGLGFGRF